VKIGVAIDTWKLPIFQRHLIKGDYSFAKAGELMSGCTIITVTTEDPEALKVVVIAALEEAAKTRRPE